MSLSEYRYNLIDLPIEVVWVILQKTSALSYVGKSFEVFNMPEIIIIYVSIFKFLNKYFYRHLKGICTSLNIKIGKFDVCNSISAVGETNQLKWAHLTGFKWHFFTCFLAAIENHTDILKYALENKCPHGFYHGDHIKKISDNGITVSKKSRYRRRKKYENNLQILKNFLKIKFEKIKLNGFHDLQSNITNAITKGYLDVLEYLYLSETRILLSDSNYESDQFTYAAKHGHLHIIQWTKNSFDDDHWNKISFFAAEYGHLHILKYMWSCKYMSSDIERIKLIIKIAENNQHNHVVQWLCTTTMTSYTDLIHINIEKCWQWLAQINTSLSYDIFRLRYLYK